MSHRFAFRPGTTDETVFNEVNFRNDYRLPDSLDAHSIVVDIGTHIGSFCHAALVRGSTRVYGFEASPENYECARRNLASFGDRATVYNQAVWRSDRKVETLRFGDGGPSNKGAGHVLGSTGQAVSAVRFDDIISRVTKNGRERVRLVKIDCEGSEFPILLTSKTLHLIDEIKGEYHNYTEQHGPDHPFVRIPLEAEVAGYHRYTIFELSWALRLAGFDVEVVYHDTLPTLTGLFFARRVARPIRAGDRLRWHRDGVKQRIARLKRAG